MRWFPGPFSLICACLVILSSQSVSAEPHVQQRRDEHDGPRLEIQCVLNGRDYCRDKPLGFKYNDGCRECQCKEEDAFCRSPKCEQFVDIRTNPEDYCRKVLDENAKRLEGPPHPPPHESDKPSGPDEPLSNEENREVIKPEEEKPKGPIVDEITAASAELETQATDEKPVDNEHESKPTESEAPVNLKPVAFMGPRHGAPEHPPMHASPRSPIPPVLPGRPGPQGPPERPETLEHPGPLGPPGILEHPEPLGLPGHHKPPHLDVPRGEGRPVNFPGPGPLNDHHHSSIDGPHHPQPPLHPHQQHQGPPGSMPNIKPIGPFQGPGHEPIHQPHGPFGGPMQDRDGTLPEQLVTFDDVLKKSDQPLQSRSPLLNMDREKGVQHQEGILDLIRKGKSLRKNGTRQADTKLLFDRLQDGGKSGQVPTKHVKSQDETLVDRFINWLSRNGNGKTTKDKLVGTETAKSKKGNNAGQTLDWNRNAAIPGRNFAFEPGFANGPLHHAPHGHHLPFSHEAHGGPGAHLQPGPFAMNQAGDIGAPHVPSPFNDPFMAERIPGAFWMDDGADGPFMGQGGLGLGGMGPAEMGPGAMGPGGMGLGGGMGHDGMGLGAMGPGAMGPGGMGLGGMGIGGVGPDGMGLGGMGPDGMGPSTFDGQGLGPFQPGHHGHHDQPHLLHLNRVPRIGADGLEAAQNTVNTTNTETVTNGTAAEDREVTETEQETAQPDADTIRIVPQVPQGTFLMAARILSNPNTASSPVTMQKASSTVRGVYNTGGGQVPGMWSHDMSRQYLLQKINKLQKEVKYWRYKYRNCETYRKKIRAALNTEMQRPRNTAYSMRELFLTFITISFGGFWLRRLI